MRKISHERDMPPATFSPILFMVPTTVHLELDVQTLIKAIASRIIDLQVTPMKTRQWAAVKGQETGRLSLRSPIFLWRACLTPDPTVSNQAENSVEMNDPQVTREEKATLVGKEGERRREKDMRGRNDEHERSEQNIDESEFGSSAGQKWLRGWGVEREE